jgi:putative transposase
MKAKQFTEEQIIGGIEGSRSRREDQRVVSAAWHFGSEFYNWKAKYSGMTVSEAGRLRELESENAKLKRLLAEAELDKTALKDLLV